MLVFDVGRRFVVLHLSGEVGGAQEADQVARCLLHLIFLKLFLLLFLLVGFVYVIVIVVVWVCGAVA